MLFCLISLHCVNGINKVMMMMMMTGLSVDSASTTAPRTSASSDRSSDASNYVLPWKIRRVKKHKLDRLLVNAPSRSSSSKYRHDPALSPEPVLDDGVDGRRRRVTSADCYVDSDDEDDDNDDASSASSESLDSIVERILENAVSETDRQRSPKRKRQDGTTASSGIDWREEKHEVDELDHLHPNNKHRLTATNKLSANEINTTSSNKQKRNQQHDYIKSAHRRRQHQLRTEKTLEDLFEEALESLRDDVEYLTEPRASPDCRRRLRSSENWEKEIYDSELHDECRHYRLQTYTSHDVSRLSRGFAVLQKLDKKRTPDLETSWSNVEQHSVRSEQPRVQPTSSRSGSQCRDEVGDVAYLQRIVISAKVASSDTIHASAAVEDGVDLGLEAELAANQRQRTSRSSSATWDSVSVDSLVMYDDDEATVHAATLCTSSAVDAADRRHLDDEFLDKLRCLQDKYQQSQTNTVDDVDAVWIPTSLQNSENNQQGNISRDTVTNDAHNAQSTETAVTNSTTCDSQEPEEDTTMTSLDDDNVVILSDCVTSQQIVISIKLPRRSRRRQLRRSASTCSKHRVPTVPFRELRLRREIRYNNDDAKEVNSSSAIVSGADLPAVVTSSRDSDDVMNDRTSKLNDVDEVVATTKDSVVLTADALLGGDDVSTLAADAEVQYDDKDSSRSVELVPVYDVAGRSASQRVDVSRSDATRVVRLPSTSSSRLIYDTPSIVQIVDDIRRALLSGAPAARADGVAVSCEAVETVTRRGDRSTPVVRNIVVDCLPPHHSRHDDDNDCENRTSVTS